MASQLETAIRSVVGAGLGIVSEHNRKKLARADVSNPFLEGLHRPVTSEETLVDLKVTGIIPAAFNGRYLRTGPNPVTMPDPGSYHWFLGDGMMHGVRIEEGRALWYRNRWGRSKAVSAALGEPPAPGTRSKRGDNANTNIIGHAGRTWAIVEAGGYPIELSDTLDTIAHNPFDGSLSVPFSAHPHRDPTTGELHTISYGAGVDDTVWHVVVDAAGKVRRQEPIAVKDGPAIHDCALTERYVLVFDLPVTFSMGSYIAGHRYPYRWNADHTARVGLCPREGSGADTIWCEVDPCYVFHPGNAFETEDGKVIVDVVAHATMFTDGYFGPDSQRITLERWTIDPRARRVDRRVLDERLQEFPRFDERRTMRPYRYLYSVALPPHPSGALAGLETKLLRHDVERGDTIVREFGAGHHPGEFVFVPRAEDGAEQDGWLVGLVANAADETTDLYILNADDFLGPAQAVVHLPVRVPPGFHGNWVAD